jgi:uncharacterized membrane protein YesL
LKVSTKEGRKIPSLILLYSVKIQHEIVEILDEYLTIFKNNFIEKQIINHFFETVIYLMDEFITNSLLKHFEIFDMSLIFSFDQKQLN